MRLATDRECCNTNIPAFTCALLTLDYVYTLCNFTYVCRAPRTQPPNGESPVMSVWIVESLRSVKLRIIIHMFQKLVEAGEFVQMLLLVIGGNSLNPSFHEQNFT